MDFDSKLYEQTTLNPKNQFITAKIIQRILSKYNTPFKVKDVDMFREALTHPTYIKNPSKKIIKLFNKDEELPDVLTSYKGVIPLQDNSYQRLEFYGDSVIHYVLTEYLYLRFPGEEEGFMTCLRADLEKKEMLAKLAKYVGLGPYILVSRKIDIEGREKYVSIMEDSFESFIGALHLQSDMRTCSIFIINVIESHVDISSLIFCNTNYKTQLQEYYHTLKWKIPEYIDVENFGPDNSKTFKCSVLDNDNRIIGTGTGTNKKKAQQEASRIALVGFNLLEDDDDTSESEFDESDETDNSESDIDESSASDK
jgi:ribonuclease III